MTSSLAHVQSDEAFATRFGDILYSVRRTRGLRLRHLADDALPVRSLRAAEAGKLALTPDTVTDLAHRYGVELGRVLDARRPVRIDGTGSLAIGDTIVGFVPGDELSLLQGYLDAVRSIRSLGDDDLVALRRADIDALATHLAIPARAIIDRLGVLMGASGEQRRAMVGLYLANASVIGCWSAD